MNILTSIESFFAPYSIAKEGKTGFYDLQLLPKISSEKLEDLRKLVANLRNLNNKMDEATEKLISPSVFSFLARKIRVLKNRP